MLLIAPPVERAGFVFEAPPERKRPKLAGLDILLLNIEIEGAGRHAFSKTVYGTQKQAVYRRYQKLGVELDEPAYGVSDQL
ncbi:hypothetical protein [Pseudomonas monteilii]|uniref:hypothetical protein n=1 Tax=Pseudomonas monteilii TaxID=76759 RepID=UPI001F3D6792|nr:hypothetical protein [Pseudomonas monteilii]